ncbi:MAG: hypothetical protein JSR89_14785 [Proteobacteria bacterium]|nr:hypothetical protein [Pseudomonadota bacterium]
MSSAEYAPNCLLPYVAVVIDSRSKGCQNDAQGSETNKLEIKNRRLAAGFFPRDQKASTSSLVSNARGIRDY